MMRAFFMDTPIKWSSDAILSFLDFSASIFPRLSSDRVREIASKISQNCLHFHQTRSIQRILIFLAVVVAVVSAPSLLAQQESKGGSIDKLLEVSHARQIWDQALDAVKAQLSGEGLEPEGGEISESQREARQRVRVAVLALFQKEFPWEAMKGDLKEVYARNFSQEEIDGLIAFYESPVGQAFVKKAPDILTETMALMQKRMAELMPKLRAELRLRVQEEAEREGAAKP